MKHLLALLVVAVASAIPVAVAQVIAPDVLVKGITEEVIEIIKKDKEIQAGNPKKIAAVVEAKILPNFNFGRMTQIAMAVHWRRATPEQQKALIDEFRTLLVRTYSNALSMYRDQVIVFKPVRMKPDDTEVTVKSEIKQKGAQSVALDYDMEASAGGWKVYDVKVGGVSLITTYREDFAGQVREIGIDGLIKTLVSKNRAAVAKTT